MLQENCSRWPSSGVTNLSRLRTRPAACRAIIVKPPSLAVRRSAQGRMIESFLLLAILCAPLLSLVKVTAQQPLLSSWQLTDNEPSSPAPPTGFGPIGDNARCNIEDLELANDSQLYTILQDLMHTNFFRHFVVDLDRSCPLALWRRGSLMSHGVGDNESDESKGTKADEKPPIKENHAPEEEGDEFECSSPFAAELDHGAEPLCTVDTSSSEPGVPSGIEPPTSSSSSSTAPLDSNALTHLFQSGKYQSKALQRTFAWKAHSDLVVHQQSQPQQVASEAPASLSEDADFCEGNSFDAFWMDMCTNLMVPGDGSASASSSSGSTETKAPINLLLNPERNTGYNGTHIWKAIYEENCLAAGDMCLEERVLYRLLSGLHSSTTLSIAYHYYPPSKSKNRTRWEPNPTYFMRQFEDHPDRLRNLHFAYVVLLRAVRKAAPFLTRYEIRTGNIVEDETARVLLRRLLDSAVLKSCSQVFNAFDESLLWKSKDIKLRQDFKGVFRNVSAILDCVQCQQCKLHGKLTMLGYGAALKVLFMQQPVLERNEIVALINTIAKFSESLKHIRELTNLYWRSNVGTSVGGSGPGCTPPSATRNLPSAPLSGWPASTAGSMTDWVDRAVQSVADLGRHGRIDWQREAELVQLALQKNEDLLILSKHYGADLEKFLDLTTRMIRGGGIGHPTSLDPDAVIVGSGLAGLTAALNILDRGGRVVILEKEHLLGGNSNKASSGINGCCLPNEVAETRDTLETFRNDTTRSAGKSAQPELIDTLVTRSAPALTWLKTRVGVDLSLLSQLGGHATKRTHRPSNGMAGAEIMYHLSKAIREYEASGHAQILVDVKVTDLLTNDATSDNEGPGRVVGVKAQFLKNGSVAEIRAENVVLATGGFAADRSKGSYLERYRPELLSMPATAGAFSTGDGVSLATSLGAGTVDMDKVQIHPTGWVDPSDPKNLSKMLAAELMRGVGGILLNSKGERFCNELGTRAYVVEQMLSHDPTYAKTKKWDTKSVIPTFHLVLSSSAATDGKKHVDLYIHKGLMTEVSGVSGLAKHTGIPKATLLRTIQRYQQDASHGTDDFGKTSFRGVPAKDLESEVFYAGKITPVLHYCMGGITIDNEGNVLNENGDIIPGLHAAGEVTGGVHGENRLGGNSLLECTVFGTIIGQKLPIKTMPAMSSTLPPSQDMPSDKMLSRTLPSVTVSELGQHNTPEDCWVAINDVVYDLTSFADEHPAGSASIHELAGKDGTEAFAAVHNENILDEFKDARIGRLVVS